MPRFSAVALVLLAVSVCCSAQMTYHKFTQNVDHFDALNTNTYQQRYSIEASGSKAEPGKPVFIFLSGEAPMEFFEFQEASAIQWAKDFGATYISLEHRYYGESLPTPNYSTENMQYLSSQQALADAATFIESYNQTIKGHPWIVFGCSYSGALSAWFRLKYPHLVAGSVAPSGPVFAQTNYTGYYQEFGRVAAPGCVKAVKSASEEIITMLSTSSGRSTLGSMFNSCQPLSASMADNYFFLTTLMETVGGSDQYDNPHSHFPLNQTCDALTSGDTLSAWAKLVVAQSSSCMDYSLEGYIGGMKSASSQDRSWYWQKCTQFGFFKPCYKSDGCIFGAFNLALEPVLKTCEEVFGIKGMKPDTAFTNDYYGGYNLVSTNTLFTNGLFDPWHLLSVTSDLPSGVQSVLYSAGHCAPMTAPTAEDPPSLTAARTKVKSFLANVLAA